MTHWSHAIHLWAVRVCVALLENVVEIPRWWVVSFPTADGCRCLLTGLDFVVELVHADDTTIVEGSLSLL